MTFKYLALLYFVVQPSLNSKHRTLYGLIHEMNVALIRLSMIPYHVTWYINFTRQNIFYFSYMYMFFQSLFSFKYDFFLLINLSRCMRKPTIYICKTKTQISCAVTAQLISAFVFAIWIVQFPFYLYPKF